MTPTPSRLRELTDGWTTDLLVASVLGVYVLIIGGAATALFQGPPACPTWPSCRGEWMVSFTDPALLAAWTHRVATVLVGGLIVLTLIVSWPSEERDVLGALLVAAALYPIQIALGALTAVTEGLTLLSALHLVVGMAIFTALLLALLWHLEADTVAEAVIGTMSTAGSDAGSSQSSTPGDLQEGAPQSTVVNRLRAYVRLTKPKLWWLLCLVAIAAMGMAAGPSLTVETAVPTLVGGILAIGASGTFNNVLEQDVDSRMSRTDDRPLVKGQIPVRRALGFGGALAVCSVIVFLTFVNVLAATLGLLAILFYSVVYTVILKPHTPQNIVLGGAVGAFPAFIGWAAVENRVGIPALVLGGVIFLWTPAHFYNLALAYREDYARADIPMLPVVRGETVTRRHILLYLGATMLGAVLLGTMTRLGALYALTAALVGGIFLLAVVKLHRERTEQAAMRAFHASNAYLGTILLMTVIDATLV